MELELGLKLTLEDFTAADLLIARNRGGPLFSSRETDTMFILTGHLKGYRRGNIKIEINKDGTRIAVSGEKPVQEMMMLGMKMIKKEVEMKGFRKVFRIPTEVKLDKIKAKFNDEESILTISMPKLVKGVIVGGGIEEVKEEEVAKGVSGTVKVVANEVAETETLQPEECGGSSIEDHEESDEDVEKLSEASDTGSGKECKELTQEKVEPAGPKVTIPEVGSSGEERKKESPEAETTTVENGLIDDGGGMKRVESTKVVPDQAIQQPELPSPPSVEKGEVIEEHATDKVVPGVENKVQIQETSHGIEEQKESKGNQEIDHTQASDMEQLKNQFQHDTSQEEEVAKGVSGTVKAVAGEVAESETLQPEECGGSCIEDHEESDEDVKKLSEASDIGSEKECKELTQEKVEPAGPKVTIPEIGSSGEERTKKESPEAETTTVENRLIDDGGGMKRVESTKVEPDQAIQQPKLPSPPSVEKGELIEEHATDKIVPGVENKVQIQETSHGIEEQKESKGNQEIDHSQASDMEQLKDQFQHDTSQEVGRDGEIHETENHIQEDKESRSESESEIRAREKPPQEAKVDESAKPTPKRFKLCAPIMAGSALLVSVLVLVIHLIKAKNQPSNIKAKRQ